MTTKPYPESNPHPEKGPLWVQWDANNDEDMPDRLMDDTTPLVRWRTREAAIAIARQLGQEIPKRTKRVRWQDAIGERLPDGREITGARGGSRPCVAVADDRTSIGLLWLDESAPADADGMVEVLA